ncbi:MAG: RluA family pseudouridine synthase, partial [Clostridia bacterium]|nr:RluA family pseudouridine synthase [Clostridia bacterium]
MKEIIINKNDAGQRIDKLITKLFPQLPQSMLYKSLRKDCVKINNKHIKDGAFRVSEGDVLKLYIKDEFLETPDPDTAFMKIEPRLSIVYEDENILLCDKKQGMCVHADDEGSTDTLIEHIKSYLWRKGEYDPDKENTFCPALCN